MPSTNPHNMHIHNFIPDDADVLSLAAEQFFSKNSFSVIERQIVTISSIQMPNTCMVRVLANHSSNPLQGSP
ncbi:hypothetical protein [Methylotenera versatilis]|uniref:hypothetical protein n=1 Tax=Methylotenera versatilis TaxID=1055487 RepID=UPI00126A06EC|nr:hypothetical protein [Methylotenera versatilis]